MVEEDGYGEAGHFGVFTFLRMRVCCVQLASALFVFNALGLHSNSCCTVQYRMHGNWQSRVHTVGGKQQGPTTH